MLRKTMIATGVAAGYVLGARAGRERYEQIRRQVNTLLRRPEVQQATESLKHTATEAAHAAKDGAAAKVNDATTALKERLHDEPTDDVVLDTAAAPAPVTY